VNILFVGWNPPGTRHFWDGPGDDLHDNLAWVFGELGWITGPNFLEEFVARGCYLVHAVKCWRDPGWPTPDATRRCAPLLASDISTLQPKTICLLGRRPHLAATSPAAPRGIQPVIPDVPAASTSFRYGRGWSGMTEGRKIIITTFVNRRWNRAERKEHRACVVDALRRWASAPSLGS
jgi:uracil-DNA glycosylase